ncbi:MAG: hypothetical protein QXX17_00445 [Conexivisphaerales archaeon]
MRPAYISISMLSFLPLAVLLFYNEVPVWASELSNIKFGTVFTAGLTVSLFLIWINRLGIRNYVQLGRRSIAIPTVIFAAGLALYVLGNYSAYKDILLYESLVLLIAGYIGYRYDIGVYYFIAIPFAILASLPLGWIFLTAYSPLFLYLLLASVIGLSIVSARHSPRAMVAVSLVLVLCLVLTRYSFGIYQILLIPLPALLALLTHRKAHPNLISEKDCEEHLPDNAGFCLYCGSRCSERYRSNTTNSFAISCWLIVIILLMLVQFSTLTVTNNGTTINMFSLQGVAKTPLPSSSATWLLNSTQPLTVKGDIYASKQVYVPSTTPERINYTLYFEVARLPPNITMSWHDIPGYNFSSSLFDVSGLQGHIISYQARSNLTLVFGGYRTFTFLVNRSFQNLYIGFSIVGMFSSSNTTQSRERFEADVVSMLLPMTNTIETAASSTYFLSQLYVSFAEISTLTAGILSVSGIFLYVLFFVHRHNKLLKLRQTVFRMDEEGWTLANIVFRTKGKFTVNDLVRNLRTDSNKLTFVSFLQAMKREGFVKQVAIREKNTLRLLWKVVV